MRACVRACVYAGYLGVEAAGAPLCAAAQDDWRRLALMPLYIYRIYIRVHTRVYKREYKRIYIRIMTGAGWPALSCSDAAGIWRVLMPLYIYNIILS